MFMQVMTNQYQLSMSDQEMKLTQQSNSEPTPSAISRQDEEQQTSVEKMLGDLKLETQSKPVEPEKEEKIQESKEQVEVLDSKDFLEINRTSIMFGKSTLFPGSIEQFDVSIGLKEEMIETADSTPFMLRVIAQCKNAEFNDLDQYVFSVRSNERFEYFEEVRFKIKKKQRAQVKVAVKIPPVKDTYLIQGCLELQLENYLPIYLPISAKCQVPQIICIKDLYKPDEDTQVIKIPAKKNQIRMPPIPFKNLSNFNLSIQIQAISSQSFSNRPYDIITQNFINCQANTQFFVNLQLKQNMSYKGQMPIKDYIRKILVLKIKGSTIYYNYPIEVFVYESTNTSGMN